MNSSKLSDSEVAIPGLTSSKTLEVKETLKQLLKGEEEDEKKEKDKDRSKSKKKKDRKYVQKCVNLCSKFWCVRACAVLYGFGAVGFMISVLEGGMLYSTYH